MKELLRYCRGMRTSANGPHFLVAIKTPPEQIGATMSVLEEEGFRCQCAYLTRHSGDKGDSAYNLLWIVS